MKITRKRAKDLYEILEEERERIRGNADDAPARIDGVPVTTLWERERKKVIDRLQRLPELVTRAAADLQIVRTRGRKPKLTPEQKTMLFLFARLTNRSNRDMEALLGLLGPVFGVSVSYKTIERLYSDEEVALTLHNLFVVLLAEEGVSGRTTRQTRNGLGVRYDNVVKIDEKWRVLGSPCYTISSASEWEPANSVPMPKSIKPAKRSW